MWTSTSTAEGDTGSAASRCRAAPRGMQSAPCPNGSLLALRPHGVAHCEIHVAQQLMARPA